MRSHELADKLKALPDEETVVVGNDAMSYGIDGVEQDPDDGVIMIVLDD